MARGKCSLLETVVIPLMCLIVVYVFSGMFAFCLIKYLINLNEYRDYLFVNNILSMFQIASFENFKIIDIFYKYLSSYLFVGSEKIIKQITGTI